MNLKQFTGCLAAALLSATAATAQTTLAKWTFETSQPAGSASANTWFTNVVAETGAGVASALHAGASVYSTPAGNGSAHSFSSTVWAVGDCYQFAVSTLGSQNIAVSYDQTASSTGPGKFYFEYSTDGINFTTVGGVNTVQVNGSPNTAWSAGTAQPLYTTNFDLSAVTAINNASVVYFRLADATTTSANGGTVATGGTCRVDNFAVTAGASSGGGGTAPLITGIAPASLTTNAGSTVAFTVSATGSPATNFWYKVSGSTTNLIAGATSASLTLTNVLAGNTAGYFAILTNSYGSATSSIASLTVTGDPSILAQPVSAGSLVDGSVQFSATVAATSPSFQWYQYDGVSAYAPVSNGTQTSGSVVAGAKTATLTITNLQLADPTNFVLVVTNIYGSATSSVASLLSVATTGQIAFWNFNQTNFPATLGDPSPWFGSGTALAFGCSVESGSPEPLDGPGFGLGATNFSWATYNYPLTGSNKQCGVQFNVSTVGAKNIMVAYDSRVSATASDYERLQYTTNGTTWIDYPTSSSFGHVGTTYESFNYSLVGFPGAANNPNFGIRVVTEYASTATYGISSTNTYIGTANTYGTGGTVTYDRVSFTADAITNNNLPPVVSTFTNVTLADYTNVTLNFTVSDDSTPANQLSYSAASLNPSSLSPSFAFGGTGASRTLRITPGYISDSVDAAPILVTVTDASGDSTVQWFLLTVNSVNQAPTNTLTSLVATNTLANASITIPFAVADDRTPLSGLTYSVASANNTVVPAANIVINNGGTANPSVTITPATNQVGLAQISVTVNDNDTVAPRSTTANFGLMVRPNTNVVMIDYFNYDSSGALDAISGGVWTHLSGVTGQLQAGSGVALVDTLDNTENVQAKLLGSPYTTNSSGALYASFLVTMDPSKLPILNGNYFAVFNDGSGVTGPYECKIIATTNGAALGYYRIGINNVGADATTGQVFPLDLSPYETYAVVASLTLSNGFSTVWVSPASQSSPSVTDTNKPTLYNISAFELRESGADAGSVSVGDLKVGTTFDSVFPSLNIQTVGASVILNWSDPTLGVQSSTNLLGPYVDLPGATAPYTNSTSSSSTQFYRFGQ